MIKLTSSYGECSVWVNPSTLLYLNKTNNDVSSSKSCLTLISGDELFVTEPPEEVLRLIETQNQPSLPKAPAIEV